MNSTIRRLGIHYFYPFWGITKPGLKNLIRAENLAAFLSHVRDRYGVSLIKQYQVVTYRLRSGEERVRVFFIRHFGGEFKSGFIVGKDLPPLPQEPDDKTDAGMQKAIWTRKPVIVPAADPRNKYGKTVVIVPSLFRATESLKGVTLYQFEARRS